MRKSSEATLQRQTTHRCGYSNMLPLPCRRPAYQYEAERIEGAVNIPTFRPVAGRGKWDVIKKIAMGALAMKATGALHSNYWALGHWGMTFVHGILVFFNLQ